jgi:hypothetical protein
MSLIRVLRTAAATLTRTIYVDETPTDAAGAVTVAVTRLDGTAVTSGNATHAGTGVYTFVLPGQAQLDHLNVEWTGSVGGGTVALADRVEIVGGFLFGLAEARASDMSLASTVTYPTSTLAAKRIEVEQECDRLCGWSFVPRFARAVLAGTGTDTVSLPDRAIRALRSVKTRSTPAEAYTSVPNLAYLAVSPGGTLTRYDGGLFPAGYGSTVVEYEHGLDNPTTDLADAAMTRLRSRLNMHRSGIPDRTSSYTDANGATYRVVRPTRGTTGLDEVDAVYQRYEAPPLGFA